MKIQPRCESPLGCPNSGGYIPLEGSMAHKNIFCFEHRRRDRTGDVLRHMELRKYRMKHGSWPRIK